MLENISVTEERKDQLDYKELAKKYLETLEYDFSESFIEQFVEVANSMKLNPFLKEMHVISYETKDKGMVHKYVTGYMVYIKRAERSGKLDGWEVVNTGRDGDITSTITIYRKDWNKPFRHSVRLRECADFDSNGMLRGSWKKMPTFMCEKVATSQGFRLCFPDELAGMPYTQDELPAPIPTETKEETKLKEMGMQKASDLQQPEKQTDKQKMLAELEKSYKGGPSTDKEKEEIEKYIKALNPDMTDMFTREERRTFASYRKEKFTAQELLDYLKTEYAKRWENAVITMGQREQIQSPENNN